MRRSHFSLAFTCRHRYILGCIDPGCAFDASGSALTLDLSFKRRSIVCFPFVLLSCQGIKNLNYPEVDRVCHMLLTFDLDVNEAPRSPGRTPGHLWASAVVGAPIGGLTSLVGATPRTSPPSSLAPAMTLPAMLMTTRLAITLTSLHTILFTP